MVVYSYTPRLRTQNLRFGFGALGLFLCFEAWISCINSLESFFAYLLLLLPLPPLPAVVEHFKPCAEWSLAVLYAVAPGLDGHGQRIV